jgi:seryl-tRNA synthetase
MIDLKDLRENPDRYRTGAARKQMTVDIDRLLELDTSRRETLAKQESLRAEQNKLAKETGPKIGPLMGQLKKAEGAEKDRLQAEIDAIKAAPAALKEQIQSLDAELKSGEDEFRSLLLSVPLPPDEDVPVGESADDNVELRRWAPKGWDYDKTFEENRGFKPKSHIELMRDARARRLPARREDSPARGQLRAHRYGHAAAPGGAAVRVRLHGRHERVHAHDPSPCRREEAMVGTGFFPGGRDQAYHIDEIRPRRGHDLYLTGTGEVGLMGLHQDEILDEADLPIQTYVTVSTCFRREAGAAGKDTAGLYRIHQFDKVEQVVICRADERRAGRGTSKMIGFVETLLQSLELPYRLLQCCTGDLGVKNADMIDIECWMPGRGEVGADGAPAGDFGETHSASRLYDYQCRRLNMRYRAGGEGGQGRDDVLPLAEQHRGREPADPHPDPRDAPERGRR